MAASMATPSLARSLARADALFEAAAMTEKSYCPLLVEKIHGLLKFAVGEDEAGRTIMRGIEEAIHEKRLDLEGRLHGK